MKRLVRSFGHGLKALVSVTLSWRMRTSVKIAIGVAIALTLVVGIGIASIGPIVRGKVRALGRARGLEITVGKVKPRLGKVWLDDVRVRIEEVPAAEIVLAQVEVSLTTGLKVTRVAAHGGTIAIEGAAEDVEGQLQSWRKSHPNQGQAGGAGGGRAYSADGIQFVWRGAYGDSQQHAWGLRYTRNADGSETLGADLVRLSRRGISLELDGPSLELSRRDGTRVLTRVAARSVAGRLDLSSLGAQPPRAPKTNESKPNESKPNESEPRKPGRLLRERFASVASLVSQVLPPSASLELSSLSLDLVHDGQSLHVGPARLVVGRDEKRVHAELVPGKTEQRTPLEVRLDVPIGDGDVKIGLSGGPVSFAALGVADGSFGLVDVSNTDVSAQGEIVLRDDGDTLSFSGNSEIERLSINDPRIAEAAMRGLNLGWRGRGTVAGDLQRLELQQSQFRFGKTRIELAGDLEWKDEKLKRGNLRGGVPLASCQSMLESAPAGLLPLLRGVAMDGTFSLQASAKFDFDDRSPPQVSWDMANDCRVRAVPPQLDPGRFAKPWVREVMGADSRPVTQETGPGTPSWVPIGAISPHMSTAIVICEDSRFYRHRGFDQQAIAGAIEDNLRAGKYIRGASTVSMQLAKNLYLARDKTASRKLQEAVLTVLLEQSLNKDELMELYLNVIEFGPGIYGIGPAAAYYFNSTASQLSLGQSLYLASILPNPRSHHFNANGEVTDKWLAYLHKLMRIAHKIHRITDEELDEGLGEVVAFQKPYEPLEEPDFDEPLDAASFGPRTTEEEAIP